MVEVGVIMGSQSDWGTMQAAAARCWKTCTSPHEVKIVSAHRTPDRLWEYGKAATGSRAEGDYRWGLGGAAHLPGMMASKTHIPVIGVPVPTEALSGVDSLYSIVQMPRGFPVATMAIGAAGAGECRADGWQVFWPCRTPPFANGWLAWRAVLTASVPEEPRK